MVVRASSVLTRRPLQATLAALLGTLVLWEGFAGSLAELSDGWDVALTAAVLIPVTFGIVGLMLPLAPARGLVPGLVAAGVVAAVLSLSGLDALFNAAKLVAYVLAGFALLRLFEELSWVVLVACIIPIVDIGSVYRGPTKVVVEQEPGFFEEIAISFRLPGEEGGANIGPPDILFFALFLGAAARFGLRVGWTWVGMTAMLSATLVATYVFELDGLPALPAISLGFLLPNADVLWDRWRVGRAQRRARTNGHG
jgi:hypothetical protein